MGRFGLLGNAAVHNPAVAASGCQNRRADAQAHVFAAPITHAERVLDPTVVVCHVYNAGTYGEAAQDP